MTLDLPGSTVSQGSLPTATATSRRMSKQRTRDTAAELTLRRALHRLGYRYRVDAPLPGLPRRPSRHPVPVTEGRGIRRRLFLAWLSAARNLASQQRRMVASEVTCQLGKGSRHD